jgi:hypothetical protein
MFCTPAADSQAASAQCQWILPEGIWWRLTQVRTSLDATNATAVIDVDVAANKSGFAGYRVGLATQLAPLTFDGTVTFAVGLVAYQSIPVDCINAALPDVWLPPGTVIQLSARTVAGFNVLQNSVLTAEGAELVVNQ